MCISRMAVTVFVFPHRIVFMDVLLSLTFISDANQTLVFGFFVSVQQGKVS